MGAPKTKNITRFANPTAYNALTWKANDGPLPNQKRTFSYHRPCANKWPTNDGVRSVAKVPQSQIAVSPSIKD